MPRVNANEITTLELEGLEGIDDESRRIFLDARDRLRGFRSAQDLSQIPELSRSARSKLLELLSFQAPEKRHLKTVVLESRNSENADFRGYRVRVKIAAPDSKPPRRRLAFNGECDSKGRAEVGIPRALVRRLEKSVLIEAIDPRGEVVGQSREKTDEFRDRQTRLKISTGQPELGPVQPPKVPDDSLQGRLISLTEGIEVDGVRVVLFGKTSGGDEVDREEPLVTTVTTRGGYFNTVRPSGRFAEAFARVDLPGSPRLPVGLEDRNAAGGRFPRRMILVSDAPASKLYDEDCGCDDLGFRGKDEVLEEFSFHSVVRTTDPELQALTLEDGNELTLADIYRLTPLIGKSLETALGQLAPGADHPLEEFRISAREFGQLSRFEDVQDPEFAEKVVQSALDGRLRDLVKKPPELFRSEGRVVLNEANAIDWDDEPTLYQATSLAHGHLLTFKQEWISDGFSLGDLIYSLPLAPGQKKQVVVLDWERRESASNEESVDFEESLNNSLSRDRDVNEIAKGTVSETSKGGSEASTWGWGVGGGVGAIIPTQVPIGALVGAAGGKGGSDSTAWQNSSREATSSSMQNIVDRTIQSANAVRSLRSSVVQTVSQGERFEVSAETVANYNHCHALTIQYFEVLRHFRVQHRLAEVRECLFVPLAMTRFDLEKAHRWQEILARYLLRRSLRRGFGALGRIRRRYAGSDLPSGRYADQTLNHLSGELRLRLRLARPSDRSDGSYLAESWHWMQVLLPHLSAPEFHARTIRDAADRDRSFERELGRRVMEEILDHIVVEAVFEEGHYQVLPVDLSLLGEFRNDRPLRVSIRLRSALRPMARSQIAFIRLRSDTHRIERNRLASIFPGVDWDVEEPTLDQILPAHSRLLVDVVKLEYRTPIARGHLVHDARVRNDLSGSDPVFLPTPLSAAELRNPRHEDLESANELLDHLNDNLEYYHKAIWMKMTPERRFLLLDRIAGPPKAEGRSLASVVENTVIGIVGNSLVMPVAPGFQLDPTYGPKLSSAESGEPISLIDYYQIKTPEPRRFSVPTKGVFAEAVLGNCNSCEVKQEERFWRWEESPIPDDPTAINPVSTDSRRSDPGSLEAKDLPSSVINVQNAPTLPNPRGAAGIEALLANGDVFRDLTGLDQNQKNAIAALQRAFQSSETFGKEAAGLTKLAGEIYMSKEGLDKSLSKIQQAKDQGLIQEGEARELAGDALRKSIPGDPPPPPSVMDTPEVRDLVREAGRSRESEVRIDRPGGESVVVRKSDDNSSSPRTSTARDDINRQGDDPEAIESTELPGAPPRFGGMHALLEAPELGPLTAYFSQYESDPRVPETADNAFRFGLVQSLGQQLRSRHIEDFFRSDRAWTQETLFAEALAVADDDPWLALLLAHNHARSHGGRNAIPTYDTMALPWDAVESDSPDEARYRFRVVSAPGSESSEEFELSFPRGGRADAVFRPKGRPSAFYLLFDPESDLGTRDFNDWYHRFLAQSVTYLHSSKRVQRDSGLLSGTRSWTAYSLALFKLVEWVSGLLESAQPQAQPRDHHFKGWLWMNALSFLEGIGYGSQKDQADSRFESDNHRRGALEGIERVTAVNTLRDGNSDPNWKWFVPKAVGIREKVSGVLRRIEEDQDFGAARELLVELESLIDSPLPFTYEVLDLRGRSVSPYELMPGQHVPDQGETATVGAFQAAITRGSDAFAALQKNENPDILFKEEEGRDDDRYMTERLATGLDTLSQLVREEWPGIKLRVTEAWDDGSEHRNGSLHHEGRAADLTTSDRDSTKLGRLAQLSVYAGLDWVFYEDNSHVHVSVQR